MGTFITGGGSIYAAMTDLKTRPADVLATQFWDADHANQIRSALIDVQAFLRGGFQLFDSNGANPITVTNGTGAPASSAAKGSLYVDRASAILYVNIDGATTWAQSGVANGTGAPVFSAAKGSLYVDRAAAALYQNTDGGTTWAPFGGGGYAGAWTAGTYSAGKLVKRGPFLFGAESQNTIDPCFDFGNMGDSTVWQVNGPGVSQNATTGVALLINSVNGQSATAVYKSTASGWDKRRLIIDAEISGSADGLEFGFIDGAQPSTSVGTLGLVGITGCWGACIDIYDPINPGFFPIVNGTQVSASRVADDNTDMTMASNQKFGRWYLDLVDNGAGAGTMTMTLYRNADPGVLVGGSNNFRFGFIDDLVQLATWTVTRPTFTSWRFAVGAHTGGANGIFAAKHAYARYTGPEWSTLALLPTRK